jgi:hypothetical protein
LTTKTVPAGRSGQQTLPGEPDPTGPIRHEPIIPASRDRGNRVDAGTISLAKRQRPALKNINRTFQATPDFFKTPRFKTPRLFQNSFQPEP